MKSLPTWTWPCAVLFAGLTAVYVLVTSDYEGGDALVVLVPFAALVGVLIGGFIDVARSLLRRARHSGQQRRE